MSIVWFRRVASRISQLCLFASFPVCVCVCECAAGKPMVAATASPAKEATGDERFLRQGKERGDEGPPQRHEKSNACACMHRSVRDGHSRSSECGRRTEIARWNGHFNQSRLIAFARQLIFISGIMPVLNYRTRKKNFGNLSCSIVPELNNRECWRFQTSYRTCIKSYPSDAGPARFCFNSQTKKGRFCLICAKSKSCRDRHNCPFP